MGGEKKLDGKGKEYKDNKLIYEGEYYNGMRDGKGKEYNEKGEDDTELEGIYYNNALNGFTRIYFPNKEIFKGEIFDDEAGGYGVYYFSRQGCQYEGYWEENYKNGIGKENWWYRDNYEGEFKNGKKNGIGVYHWQKLPNNIKKIP